VVEERRGDRVPDQLVVERDVVVGRCVDDGPVVGDDRDVLRLRVHDDRRSGLGVDGVEHDDVGSVGDGRLGLLLLGGGITVRILVVDFAFGAELADLLGEQGRVLLLVAGGREIGHQEGDVARLLAAPAVASAGRCTARARGECADQGHRGEHRRHRLL
jgi:hypothetical protein